MLPGVASGHSPRSPPDAPADPRTRMIGELVLATVEGITLSGRGGERLSEASAPLMRVLGAAVSRGDAVQ